MLETIIPKDGGLEPTLEYLTVLAMPEMMPMVKVSVDDFSRWEITPQSIRRILRQLEQHENPFFDSEHPVEMVILAVPRPFVYAGRQVMKYYGLGDTEEVRLALNPATEGELALLANQFRATPLSKCYRDSHNEQLLKSYAEMRRIKIERYAKAKGARNVGLITIPPLLQAICLAFSHQSIHQDVPMRPGAKMLIKVAKLDETQKSEETGITA